MSWLEKYSLHINLHFVSTMPLRVVTLDSSGVFFSFYRRCSEPLQNFVSFSQTWLMFCKNGKVQPSRQAIPPTEEFLTSAFVRTSKVFVLNFNSGCSLTRYWQAEAGTSIPQKWWQSCWIWSSVHTSETREGKIIFNLLLSVRSGVTTIFAMDCSGEFYSHFPERQFPDYFHWNPVFSTQENVLVYVQSNCDLLSHFIFPSN